MTWTLIIGALIFMLGCAALSLVITLKLKDNN